MNTNNSTFQKATISYAGDSVPSVEGLPVAIAEPVSLDYQDSVQQNQHRPEFTKRFETEQLNYVQPQPQPLNKRQLTMLTKHGYTKGLAKSLAISANSFAKRIWIVDNSGSMQRADGHYILERNSGISIVQCTRWDEIYQCVKYHIELASILEAPTSFRLLNHPGAHVGSQRFDVASFPGSVTSEVQEAHDILRKVRPQGCTPLTRHILDIQAEVSRMAPQLRESGKRVAIIIATDGLPSDSQGYSGKKLRNKFVDSLRKLEGLPVWLVIRLCTDDEDVVEFYNDLDSVLELSVEVLDDFCGEAQEVREHNPWLNYTLPLHRMREFGFHDRIFDMLDERKLTKSELRDLCILIFGEENFYDGNTSDPLANWSGFVTHIEHLLRGEKQQWNPIKKQKRPLIQLSKLHRSFGECNMMQSMGQSLLKIFTN